MLNAGVSIKNRLLNLALPLFIGALTCYVVIGFAALNPSYTAWLSREDMATHYLGWVFFRHGAWQLPLGANPDYGLTISSAIVFSDSLPLFAIPLKLISAWLPEPFQYTGFWLFSCFLLQSWFAWKLVGLATPNRLLRALGTGLFVFAPPMIVRLGGHMTLVGQFVVLAALYLSFNAHQKHQTGWWAMLLGTTVLIHPYLMLMVGALWAADFLRRTLPLQIRSHNASALRELVLVATVVGLTSWQAGYYVIGDAVALGGFGVYRMNLLAPIDSGGWSTVMMDLPGGPGDDEGFNYLGLGILLLGTFTLPALLDAPSRFRLIITSRPILLTTLILLAFLSLSSNVGVGAENYLFPIPIWADKLTNVFRASGRMFWPVFYSFLFTALFIVIRHYRAPVAAGLIGIALVVQIVDTRPGWRQLQPMYAKHVQAAPDKLQSEFWQQAAHKYRAIRMVSPRYINPDWRPFATFAAEHRMTTDAVYLARMSTEKIEVAQGEAMLALTTGKFDRDSLYIVDDNKVLLAASHLNPTADLLARIDGYNVVAPGWKKCASCTAIESELKAADFLTSFGINQRIDFIAGGNGLKTLVHGWAGSEPGGTWTEGNEAELILGTTGVRPNTILINAGALLAPNHTEQIVEFQINDGPVTRVTFDAALKNPFPLPIPAAPASGPGSAMLDLRIKLLNPARPVDLGMSADSRLLGIALVSITLLQ